MLEEFKLNFYFVSEVVNICCRKNRFKYQKAEVAVKQDPCLCSQNLSQILLWLTKTKQKKPTSQLSILMSERKKSCLGYMILEVQYNQYLYLLKVFKIFKIARLSNILSVQENVEVFYTFLRCDTRWKYKYFKIFFQWINRLMYLLQVKCKIIHIFILFCICKH